MLVGRAVVALVVAFSLGACARSLEATPAPLESAAAAPPEAPRGAGPLGTSVAVLAATAQASIAPPEERPWEVLDADEDAPEAWVLPPRVSTGERQRPVVVVLHGMCSKPAAECPVYGAATRDAAWLVCPRAPAACADGDGAMWRWPYEGGTGPLDALVSRIARAYPGEVDEGPRVVVGFSQGALAAIDLVQRGEMPARGLLLIGAEVWPDAAALGRAGVKRVVMAAGELDMMRGHMESVAAALDQQGIETQFMSLGDIGHDCPADMDERVAEAIAWVSGGEGES